MTNFFLQYGTNLKTHLSVVSTMLTKVLKCFYNPNLSCITCESIIHNFFPWQKRVNQSSAKQSGTSLSVAITCKNIRKINMYKYSIN